MKFSANSDQNIETYVAVLKGEMPETPAIVRIAHSEPMMATVKNYARAAHIIDEASDQFIESPYTDIHRETEESIVDQATLRVIGPQSRIRSPGASLMNKTRKEEMDFM
jgi:hypothetical protein